MSKTIRMAGLAIFGALAMQVAPALAQSEVANPPDPYVHKAVAVEFPQTAGDFQRGRVVEYNADGSDASVGYGLADMPGEITLYVYPVRGYSCQQEFDGARSAITSRGGTEKTGASKLTFAAFEGSTQNSAEFTIKPGGYGYEHPELISFLWVGCLPGDEWLVKYRGSFFMRDSGKVDGIAESLFSEIDWTTLTDRP